MQKDFAILIEMSYTSYTKELLVTKFFNRRKDVGFKLLFSALRRLPSRNNRFLSSEIRKLSTSAPCFGFFLKFK